MKHQRTGGDGGWNSKSGAGRLPFPLSEDGPISTGTARTFDSPIASATRIKSPPCRRRIMTT